MTPTLLGRIQTRLFLLATIGAAWTILVTPLLPRPAVSGLISMYAMTIGALILVAILGVGWELAYHAIQQYRWEKDWPSLFGLITGFNEGILLWILLEWSGSADVPEAAFLLHFASTWVLIWLTANGPLRVLFPRWRFRGGRIG